MKKLIALLMAAVMVLSFSACGQTATAQPAAEESGAGDVPTAAAEEKTAEFPTKEITITAPRRTLSSVNFPSISVIVPIVVPFTTTEAPATGPIWSSTRPVTLLPCCTTIVSGPVGLAAIAPAAPNNTEIISDLISFELVHIVKFKSLIK